MVTRAELSGAQPETNPINCAKKHNAETYILAKLPLTTPAYQLPEGVELEVANSLCRAWGKVGVLEWSNFNYWPWCTPEPAAWVKGEKWLRCNAIKVAGENQPPRFISWKGQKKLVDTARQVKN